jgi:hypothetical protein
MKSLLHSNNFRSRRQPEEKQGIDEPRLAEGSLSIYWVWSYYGKPGKIAEYAVGVCERDTVSAGGYMNRINEVVSKSVGAQKHKTI